MISAATGQILAIGKETSLVKIGERHIGPGAPTFITFEAGPTHDGVETAKLLIDHAAAAGADAIKFQILDPDRLVADRTMLFDYDILADRETGQTERISEPLYDILCRRALSAEQWRAVKAHADARNLAFFATVGFEEEVDFVAELGCQSIKITSGDVNHYPLIRRAARTGLCLQLDTGSSTLGEIEAAVDVIRAEGNESIIIHHCPSGYPARMEGINLRVLQTLQHLFDCPIAFSDHTPGWEMDIAAVTLGASLVEKTISLDRTTRSVEHIMSLEPADMQRFITAIRHLETALGQKRRLMSPEERQKRQNVRRSIHLKEAGQAGQALTALALDFRRPGHGLPPSLLDDLGEAKLRRDLPAGHRLSFSDLEI